MEIRLKKQKDFDILFNKGNRIYSKSLTVIYLKNNSLKFGISLSKKHGKAVVRNRIKRLLRSAFKSFLKQINGNYYIVILPKVKDTYEYNVFLNDLKYCLKKGNIIND